MARPNFFCGIEALNRILQTDFENEYKDVDLTMDVIELPYLFILTADAENWTFKVMRRGEMYSHSDDLGIEAGCVTVNKETEKMEGTVPQELSDSILAFFFACQRLGYYFQDNGLEESCADLDPEEAGILLYVEDDTLKHKIVSGKARPDLMVSTFFGGATMGRPYMDEFMSNSASEMMSFEEELEAAEDGDEDAMESVAMTYLDGDEDENVEPDPEKALYWMEKAAEEGNSSAEYNTALFYAKGHGTERDFEKAAEWMEKAAEDGDEDAEDLAPKYRQAVADLAAAENGDAAAQGRLAGFYMSLAGSLDQAGPGTDYEESLKWAKKAAEKGDGEGFWTLALAYEHGRAVAEDADLALEYYKKGAQAGHAKCLSGLGCTHLRGDTPDANMKLGFELTLRASLLGVGEAMANLGRCYQFGNGCMGNMKKAVIWYKKSLELVPNAELEGKTRRFEMFGMATDEDYYGEDSDRELTAEEQAFLDAIDASLPEEIRQTAHDPDSVFKGISFESGENEEDFEDEDVEDLEDEDEDEDDDEALGHLAEGYLDILASFSEDDESENL